jgi:hypothetical protein
LAHYLALMSYVRQLGASAPLSRANHVFDSHHRYLILGLV